MPALKRNLLLTLPLILINLLSINTFAQYPGMGAVYSNMNRQFMNQQMNQMMRAGMMRGFASNNNKHTFWVTMKDSTTIKVSSQIFTDTVLHKDYLVFRDMSVYRTEPGRHRKIYVNETVKISRPGTRTIYTGMANDTCWMFKAVEGPITAYSYLSEGDDESSLIGIQNGGGPIKKLNNENLKEMIGTDDEAMKLFDKKKYLAAIKKYNKDQEKAKK